MLVVDSHPRLSDLHRLSSTLNYPVSARRLVEMAKNKDFAPETISFYQTLPKDIIFRDRDELEALTEQLEILQTQQAPDEDIVHGAED